VTKYQISAINSGMMVTSVPPYETFSLIKNNILHQSLGQVGHVKYSFKTMLFISTGIFDYKLRPQILSVVSTTDGRTG
jgi:hypothetical protein